MCSAGLIKGHSDLIVPYQLLTYCQLFSFYFFFLDLPDTASSFQQPWWIIFFFFYNVPLHAQTLAEKKKKLEDMAVKLIGEVFFPPKGSDFAYQTWYVSVHDLISATRSGTGHSYWKAHCSLLSLRVDLCLCRYLPQSFIHFGHLLKLILHKMHFTVQKKAQARYVFFEF